MGLIRAAMARHGAAVFAREQTKGKGQRNRSWASEKDRNIALSLVLEPQALDPSLPFLLSMAIALATADLYRQLVPDDISIKWPNDLYWRDRKAAGILIENLWQGGQWNFAVAGIGINVNQTDFGELQGKAVSLRQITGRSEDPEALALRLCACAEARYAQLLKGASSIIADYNELLYRRGESVRFRRDNRLFEARIDSVNEQGLLLVHHALPERFAVGDVEWILS